MNNFGPSGNSLPSHNLQISQRLDSDSLEPNYNDSYPNLNNLNSRNGEYNNSGQVVNYEQRPPLNNFTSPGNSNLPTQGDLYSPKEFGNHRYDQDPPHLPNQSPNRRGSPQRDGIEGALFSFRRGRNQVAESHDNSTSVRDRSNVREDTDHLSPRNDYEKKR